MRLNDPLSPSLSESLSLLLPLHVSLSSSPAVSFSLPLTIFSSHPLLLSISFTRPSSPPSFCSSLSRSLALLSISRYCWPKAIWEKARLRDWERYRDGPSLYLTQSLTLALSLFVLLSFLNTLISSLPLSLCNLSFIIPPRHQSVLFSSVLPSFLQLSLLLTIAISSSLCLLFSPY